MGGTLVMLAAAAVLPRGPLALWMAGSAVASSGETNGNAFYHVKNALAD